MSLAFGITLTCVMGGLFGGNIIGAMFNPDKFERMMTSKPATPTD